MDRDDDGETSYNTFVDDVALEPTFFSTPLLLSAKIWVRFFCRLCSCSTMQLLDFTLNRLFMKLFTTYNTEFVTYRQKFFLDVIYPV